VIYPEFSKKLTNQHSEKNPLSVIETTDKFLKYHIIRVRLSGSGIQEKIFFDSQAVVVQEF
jgi:hypothetical protein